MRPRREASRTRGLSLVELLIFIVIVGVGLAGILSVLNLTVRASADPLAPKQALAIAEALLEEVELAPLTWCDPDDPRAADPIVTGPADCTTAEGIGPEAGDVRPYDNVSDYHMAGFAPLLDVAGNPLPAALAGYTYNIAVTPAALGGVPAGDALRIRVTVNGPGGLSVALDGWRTRYAPLSPP